MNDFESLIFTRIATHLRAEFNGIFCTGEYVKAPPKFPCVSIIEEDNSTYLRSMDSELKEHHSAVMYQTETYSNKQTGKKSECRAIQKIIDDQFLKLGFTRTFSRFIPNYEDATIARITSRYQGVISEDGRVYRS